MLHGTYNEAIASIIKVIPSFRYSIGTIAEVIELQLKPNT